ncbi:amino acid/polyamine/organocation transporter, APC superfamily [Mucilaginibacter gossypiicola]|uniref:Amino acid/polyamine/organocation transporter, APC superfamily n=1 Tax=Mucilaginibacter gossypiicola TaxID=551995 RepID=A0A1H8T3D1_9SPHI|nr:amino acid permease [Mucilaginibacter gossypiicola]SEO85043.1 amino acid/polyamine/organocation transporter, APC superfamily [Mucilaginibacter gossypiicola]
MAKNSSQPKMKHELSLLDGTMLVSGSMIGSGIFIVSADITRNVGSAGWLIAIWIITGFMTLTAALSYGELSGMFPKAGGQYVYLKEAYNKLIAFLYGWSFFAVIQTGTIAAVGVAFSKFTAYLIPAFSEDNILFHIGFLKISAAQLMSIFIIVLLTYINTKGVKSGKIIQTTFTLTKLLSLFGLIIFGFIALKPEIWHANWSNAWDIHNLKADNTTVGLTLATAMGAIAASMVGSIFSSDAWNSVTFIAGEMKNPKRDVALSLGLGTLIVTIIYVSANVAYTGVLSMHDIATADKDRVAVAASHIIFGNLGTYIIAVMIMISTFGCNNGLILSGARVYYTMAKDGLFFKQTGELNKAGVPEFGLWIQAVVASILCLSGRYGDLLDMISFVVVIFYVLTIFGIYILRKKHPNAERPYKALGYPILPAIYIIMGLIFCVLLIIYKPQFTWPGFIIVLIGVPIYYISQRNVKKKDEALTDS